MGVLVICVPVFTAFVLFRLCIYILISYCKDYCHRVKTHFAVHSNNNNNNNNNNYLATLYCLTWDKFNDGQCSLL